jgi:hypothetical protein
MNVIKIMGGLGNQLFQYAFGRQQMLNGIEVLFANSSYSNDKIVKQTWPRPYQLDKFNIDNIIISTFNPKSKTVRESTIGHDKKLLKMKNFNFNGYWQYLDYYESDLNELMKLFTVKDKYKTQEYKNILVKIQSTESVSVHIRRGDYVLLSKTYEHFILPFEYYYEAINLISAKTIFIFSDDMEWCKEKFKPQYFSKEILFVEGLPAYLDFELIKSCNHNVISASTFSWWGAFLNSNPNKTVIAPTIWDNYKSHELIYPKDWIKI